jgi:hypothetical protein
MGTPTFTPQGDDNMIEIQTIQQAGKGAVQAWHSHRLNTLDKTLAESLATFDAEGVFMARFSQYRRDLGLRNMEVMEIACEIGGWDDLNWLERTARLKSLHEEHLNIHLSYLSEWEG